MRHISIKWRMTIWFTVVMVAIAALVLVFVMLMNRNSVTRPPEAELVYMVQRNADDVEFDHGGWDFSDVELYGHGVYTEIFDENGQRLAGTAPASVTDTADFEHCRLHTVTGSDGGTYYVYDQRLTIGSGGLWLRALSTAPPAAASWRSSCRWPGRCCRDWCWCRHWAAGSSPSCPSGRWKRSSTRPPPSPTVGICPGASACPGAGVRYTGWPPPLTICSTGWSDRSTRRPSSPPMPVTAPHAGHGDPGGVRNAGAGPAVPGGI